MGSQSAQSRSSTNRSVREAKVGHSFVDNQLKHPNQTEQRRSELTSSQRPYAVVLACADSRTSPELVFDQGLGDLFVLRVAGNVLNDETLGSIEYAADHHFYLPG